MPRDNRSPLDVAREATRLIYAPRQYGIMVRAQSQVRGNGTHDDTLSPDLRRDQQRRNRRALREQRDIYEASRDRSMDRAVRSDRKASVAEGASREGDALAGGLAELQASRPPQGQPAAVQDQMGSDLDPSPLASALGNLDDGQLLKFLYLARLGSF